MISFGNAPGNLFNRLGKCALLLKQVNTYQAAQYINLVDPSLGLAFQLASEPDIQSVVGSSYISTLSGPESASTLGQQIAQAAVNRAVFRDNPQPGQTLTQANTVASIYEVIRQMKLAGATILAQTITTTPSVFSGTGNGVVVASFRRPIDGLVLENSFAELLTLTCSQDSYTGGAVAGNEPFNLTGAGLQNNLFAFNWPLGSGANARLTAINGESSQSGNVLSNSGFESWTAGIPDSFTLVVGTTANIAQETGNVYTGTSALKIIGDGSNTLTQLKQSLSLATLTQYGFNVFMRTNPVVPGAGIMVVDLIDNNNNVIVDAGGNANTVTINLTGLNTVYTGYNIAFRTPAVLPSSYYLRIRLTTALTNGAAIYLDDMSMGAMTQAYTGGPFISVHSGSVPFAKNDLATVAVTNSRGIGGTLATFQTALYRLLSPYSISNEILWPSSASPSITDAAFIA